MLNTFYALGWATNFLPMGDFVEGSEEDKASDKEENDKEADVMGSDCD